MTTLNQCKRYRLKSRSRSAALRGSPQRRGRIVRVVIKTPRKPNSGLRKVAKVFLSTQKYVFAKIPGSGNLPQRFGVVLVRGKGYKDTPSINYSLIRGALECLPLFNKTRRRSLYGVRKPDKLKLRRVLR